MESEPANGSSDVPTVDAEDEQQGGESADEPSSSVLNDEQDEANTANANSENESTRSDEEKSRTSNQNTSSNDDDNANSNIDTENANVEDDEGEYPKTLVYKASDYTVSVEYGKEAKIPQDARLNVFEIESDTDDYDNTLAQIATELADEDTLAQIADARLIDISITSEGAEITPEKPVNVSIEWAAPLLTISAAAAEIFHVSDEGDVSAVLDNPTTAPACSSSSVRFDTDSFSTFAFVQAHYVGSLDGQQMAIVREYTSGWTALTDTAHPQNSARLAGVWVKETEDGEHLMSVTSANGSTESPTDITAWTFEFVRDNFYYIKSENDLYLNLDKERLTTSSTPQEIEVYLHAEETGSGTYPKGHYSGRVLLRVKDVPTNTYYYVNFKNDSGRNDWKGSTYSTANSQLALFAADTLNPYPAVKATKVNVGEIGAGDYIVVYQRIYNPEHDKFEFYVVCGDGSLLYAFDDGDEIEFRTTHNPEWYVIEHTDAATGLPNGYYDLQSAETGKYLAPQHNSILSNDTIGVRLPGKESGEDGNSKIESWDNSAWNYYGFNVDLENKVLSSGAGNNSKEFSFAKIIPETTGVLHPVETMDSVATGVKIEMYDFADRAVMNLFNDDTFYENGAFKQGLVKNILGTDGLPISATGRSFSELYNSSTFQGEANHLFLKSVYESTGYYEYDSYKNFAEYDASTGNFTVYDEQGIPRNGTSGSVSAFYRGNYLPYDELNINNPGTNTKLYDGLVEWTSLENPVFDTPLYLIKNTNNPDYNFGQIIETSFWQSAGGLDANGNPITYEFDGDDDLWLFLDGVLALDIGGIHSAVKGSIDFSTGVVKAGNTTTTIKQAFNDAGVFPDGEPWDPDLVDEYFAGDTFIDYSGHVMKIFYQERGKGASTLHTRFNLHSTEEGTFTTEKRLASTDKHSYSSVKFAYQAFFDPDPSIDGDEVPLYPGGIYDAQGSEVDPADATQEQLDSALIVRYEGTTTDVPFHDGIEMDDDTYDHVFYMRPGEIVKFSNVPTGIKYFVQELGVEPQLYDRVQINSATVFDDEGGTSTDDHVSAKSSSKTIAQRHHVLFENRPSENNLTNLEITKEVDEGHYDGATFEFRVMLEDADGELTYFNRGEYYVVKDVGGFRHYFAFSGGVLTDMGVQPTVCSISGSYGTIAGIPDGYTVVIENLLAGTDFFVEEIRNPQGYVQRSKTLEAGTYETGEADGADGATTLGKDAHVTFVNRRYSTITATKHWTGTAQVLSHGDIEMALCHKTAGGGLAIASLSYVLDDAIQTVEYPADTAVWYLDLPAAESINNFVVREVIYDETEDDYFIVGDGSHITVTGEIVDGPSGSAPMDNEYEVSYQEGDAQETSEGSHIYDRVDSITNSPVELAIQQVSFEKVDAEDGSDVPSASFSLYAVDSQGETITPAAYAGLVSNNDGMLIYDGGGSTQMIFELTEGDWLLMEDSPASGYLGMTQPIEITVDEDGVSYIQTDWHGGAEQTAAAISDYRTDNEQSHRIYVGNYQHANLPFAGMGGLVISGLGAAAVLLISGFILGVRRMRIRSIGKQRT